MFGHFINDAADVKLYIEFSEHHALHIFSQLELQTCSREKPYDGFSHVVQSGQFWNCLALLRILIFLMCKQIENPVGIDEVVCHPFVSLYMLAVPASALPAPAGVEAPFLIEKCIFDLFPTLVAGQGPELWIC